MLLAQTIISGLMIGGIYALISMGLNLILGVVRIINFAHGEFLMIAMYLSFIFYASMGLDPYVSAIIVIIILFVIGMITQKFLIEPILDTPASNKIFVTLGLSISFQNLVLSIILFQIQIITYKFLIEPILDPPASTKIFVTLGLSIALQNLALMIFNANHRTVQTAYQSKLVNIGGITMSVPNIIAFISAIL